MLEMDDDNSGSVSYPEFEAWWRKNGGDLEVHRALAFTVLLPDINLLLVRTVPYRTAASLRTTLPNPTLIALRGFPVHTLLTVDVLHSLPPGVGTCVCSRV